MKILPVVAVSPMDFGCPVYVIAASFLEYLAAGCAVSVDTIQQIVDEEANSGAKLVAFLAEHFDQLRLSSDQRIDELTKRHIGKVVARSSRQ